LDTNSDSVGGGHSLALSEGQKENKRERESDRKVTEEKLTVKKALAIVVLTTLAVLGYGGIILFSLPFTGSIIVSWALGLTFALAVILYCTVSMLSARLERRNKK